ncbi:MAG: hypothetical protein V4808_00010 [Pseudomonadota bacterium]
MVAASNIRRFTPARIAVVIVCALLIYLSFISAVAAVTRDANPDIALRFAPNDADALGNKAYAMTLAGLSEKNAPQIEEMAKRSYRGNAISTRPYFALIAALEIRKETAAINKLVAPVTNLSRRDAALQLWYVEHYAARDDLAKVLVHYDNLLRVHPELNNLLFERLAAGLSDGAIRQALQPYVAKRVGWVSDLLRYGLTNGGDPVALSQFVRESGGVTKFNEGEVVGRLLAEALVSAGEVDKARQFYLESPGASTAVLTTVGLSPAATGNMVPITWEMRSEGETYTTLSEIAGGQQAIIVQMAAERSSIFAHKLLILPPGKYKLAVKGRPSEPEVAADFVVEPLLYCFKPSGSRQVLDQLNILVKGAEAGSWIINVTTNCPAQWLQLKASTGRNQTASPIVVESPVISRVP